VNVTEFDVLGAEADRMRFRVRVSSGTYVRAIAHDMGQILGCGAHLSILRRTCFGEFCEADARSLGELQEAADKGVWQEMFVHPRRLIPSMPSVTATDEAASRIRNGGAVNLPEMSRAPRVKVFYGQNQLIAIANRVAGTLFHPTVVLMGAPDSEHP
jgi:tRNA pseudouridine55 synthase